MAAKAVGSIGGKIIAAAMYKQRQRHQKRGIINNSKRQRHARQHISVWRGEISSSQRQVSEKRQSKCGMAASSVMKKRRQPHISIKIIKWHNAISSNQNMASAAWRQIKSSSSISSSVTSSENSGRHE